MVLQKVHEFRGAYIARWAATWPRLPRIPLPLIQMAVTDCRDQFLRRARVVGVVGLGVTRGRNTARMMEVVIQDPVGSPSALIGRQYLIPTV